MKLTANTVQIELSPRSIVDREGWVRVQLVAKAVGFMADFTASLELVDLQRFEHELHALYSSLSGCATLRGAEPGVHVRLEAVTLGHIQGTYSFESEQREGGQTVLSGALELDQSYLPGVAGSLNALIEALSHPSVA
jgi:hypothetical protein